jgi:hypothetical protein
LLQISGFSSDLEEMASFIKEVRLVLEHYRIEEEEEEEEEEDGGDDDHLRCIANYMGWSFVRKVVVCMSK